MLETKAHVNCPSSKGVIDLVVFTGVLNPKPRP